MRVTSAANRRRRLLEDRQRHFAELRHELYGAERRLRQMIRKSADPASEVVLMAELSAVNSRLDQVLCTQLLFSNPQFVDLFMASTTDFETCCQQFARGSLDPNARSYARSHPMT